MLNWNAWTTTLPVMAVGMLGIFLVIGALVLVVYLLNYLTGKKKKQ